MGLRIRTNIASKTVRNNLEQVSAREESSFSKLSSGKRISKASDDAAGLAIAAKLDSQVRSLRQATRNANSGIALIQSTEGSLNEASNILTRLRELTIQAASDDINDSQRKLLNEEYGQLSAEIDRISKSVFVNGIQVLGDNDDRVLDFQIGPNAGKSNIVSFDSGDINSTTDFIGINGTSIGEKDSALDAMESLDNAISVISGQRAKLGSIQSRLHSTVGNLEVQTLNQDSALSYIQDVDVAQEAAKLASTRVMKEAGISSLAQANNIPNGALRLLA